MISDGQQYSAFLTALHKARKASTTEEMIKNRKRQRLSARDRQHILSKTGSRCHICGGLIDGEWDASEVIFRLLQLTHGDVPDVPLSLCVELAGRPEYISRLLQCGIRTFSIAAPLIPIIKETIRNSWCSAPPDTLPLKQR